MVIIDIAKEKLDVDHITTKSNKQVRKIWTDLGGTSRQIAPAYDSLDGYLRKGKLLNYILGSNHLFSHESLESWFGRLDNSNFYS